MRSRVRLGEGVKGSKDGRKIESKHIICTCEMSQWYPLFCAMCANKNAGQIRYQKNIAQYNKDCE